MLHTVALVTFWVATGLVLYCYLIYPLLLLIIYSLEQVRRDLEYLPSRADRRAAIPTDDQLPNVSFVIAAHNEEKHLPEKLKNIRELQYPRQKLQVIIVSDGSSDGTNELLNAAGDAQIEEPRDVAVGRRDLSDVVVLDRATNVNLVPFVAPNSRRDRRISDADIKQAFDKTKRFDMVIVAAVDLRRDPSARFFAGLVDHIVLVSRTDADDEGAVDAILSALGLNARKVRGAVLTDAAA